MKRGIGLVVALMLVSSTFVILGSGTALAHPPDCPNATASPSIQWPPNHKYRAITISVPDVDGDSNTVTVTGVTQDEALNETGSGNTSPDAVISKGKVSVRAERSGRLDGRVYRISFTATDNDGSCSGSVWVGVPHDQGNGSTPIDSGQNYNSLG